MNKRNNKIKLTKQYKQFFNIIAVSLIIGFIAGISINYNNIKPLIARNEINESPNYDATLVGSSEISLCFTPPTGCAKVISNLISQAKESVYVQAYGITSSEIVDKLIAAHGRGVRLRILLDKSNLSDKHSKIQQLQESGIDVSIDKVSGIAHNKVIILDERKVITGSFNFTKSADTRNAENVIIVNNKQIASKYLQNWLSRKGKNNK